MISIDRFGKDHWSALGYIETCCVDLGCLAWYSMTA